MKTVKNKFFENCAKLAGIVISCFLLLFLAIPIQANAQAAAVQIIEIDYDEASMVIDPKGNTKVYYSDSKKSTWYEVEGSHSANGYLILDLSWISESSEYELNLKGSENDTIVSCTLPAANRSLKVSYDRIYAMLSISAEENATTFEWRKSTSYQWNGPISIGQEDKAGEAFLKTLESLRTNNGKIYVRTPQEKGTSATEVGCRPSKQVLVTISARSSAPKISISPSKLTLNTRETYEYRVRKIGGTATGIKKWRDCEANMSLSSIAPEALYSSTNTSPKDVTIAFRVAETERTPYSDTFFLEVPAQRKAPTEIITSKTSKSFSIQLPEASSTNAYEYCIQKPGTKFSETNASWRSVTNNRPVVLYKSSIPEGTVLRIRLRGETASSTREFKLPSAYNTCTVSYLN